MAGYPRQYPHNTSIQPALMGNKGHDGDPCSEHSGNYSIFSPLEHSDEVNLGDLAKSPMIRPPTGFEQCIAATPPDPAALVYVMKTTGQSQAQILGMANDLLNYDSGEGGQSLMQSENVQKLLNTELKILIPPDIKDGESRGAKVKKIKEKGKKHKHALLQGLPSHAAMFDVSGYRLPQVKDVPTAKQAFSQIATNDMLSQLAGELMSLGGMMQGLMSSFGSTKGAGGAAGASGIGNGSGAGGGAGGYVTQQPVTYISNVPGANAVITGTGAFAVTSNTHAQLKSSASSPTLTTSLSYNIEGDKFSSKNSVDKSNKKITSTTQDSVTEVVGDTTTTTNTTSEVTGTSESGSYDTNYISADMKKGKPLLRWKEKYINSQLTPRVNVEAVKALTQEQVNNIISDADLANTETQTITTTKINEQIKSVRNFKGSYRDFYGEDSDVTRMDIIMHSLDNHIKTAMNSLSLIVQGMENGGTGSFPTANRVHLETYLDNATDLFCQCQSVGDLMSVLKRLQHDETLFGKDQLEKMTIKHDTAWGTANVHVDSSGSLVLEYSDEQLNQQANTLQMMLDASGSPSVTGMASANGWGNTSSSSSSSSSNKPSSSPGGGSGGGGSGGNMFGRHAATMFDMFKRMAPEHEKESTKLHKELNQSAEMQDLWKMVETTMKGGNPVDFEKLLKMFT